MLVLRFGTVSPGCMGSGFPKSLDVSKAIDKRLGAEREVVGTRQGKGSQTGVTVGGIGGGASEGFGHGNTINETSAHTPEAKQWQGWGTALKPAFEPIVVGRKPFAKGSTVAANVLLHGVGGLNIDASRIGSRAEKPQKRPAFANGVGNGGVAYGRREGPADTYAQGRWPANVILDEYSAGLLDEQSGENPSRFFYCAKASKRDRNEGLGDLPDNVVGSFFGNFEVPGNKIGANPDKPNQPGKNTHPTVKPTALMRYLIKLVTPAGGTVLDPFTGSGSTGKAALLDGYKFVGAELTEEYLPIIKGRLRWAYEQEGDDETLFRWGCNENR